MARGTTSTRCRLITKGLRSKLILVAGNTTRRVTVDIRDLIKHSTKKSGKCPKTLRDDGSRNLRVGATWSPRRDAK